MQQGAVRVTESMPIDSLQTSSLARGSECLFSEIIRRERNALAFGKYQCVWRVFWSFPYASMKGVHQRHPFPFPSVRA